MARASARRHGAHEEEHENHERWLITYADMITLLMVLFIVLYSISQVDLAKFRRLKEGFGGGFGGPTAAGIQDGGVGPMEGGGGVFDAGLPNPEVLESAGAGLAAASARVAARREELALLEGVEGEIQQGLAAAGLEEAVHFRQETRGLVVTIVSDRVLFAPGEAVLRPEGREIIDHLAPALGRLPHQLAVEGHTDSIPISGRYPSNWELSTTRATAVLRELAEHHGITPSRLQAAGYADQRPVAGNETAEGRSSNRRVELVVLSQVALSAATGAPVEPIEPTTTKRPIEPTTTKQQSTKGEGH